jgi:hypothetical protein
MLNTIAKVAQGNPTIITDSSSRRLQKLNVYGQSEQDSTTGKNLLNPTGATKEGWNIALPNFKLEVGKQYTYTAPILEGSEACALFAIASDTELVPYLQSGETHTFTVADEADFSQGIFLAGGSEDALTLGDELTAMVELGSVATEFEPYTGGKPSPSPDYPQEIISKEVSAIKITGKNLFDFVTLAGGEGATFEKNGLSARIENGYLITTGTAINDAFTKNEFEPYKEQTITLSDPITLRGIRLSSGGNITIDGQQYIADYIDSLTGKINRLNGYIDSYNGEEVGTIYMSTTGQLTTGAKVIYKLSQPTQEDLPQQDQEAIRALTTYYPNTVIQTGCWNEVTYSAKRGG